MTLRASAQGIHREVCLVGYASRAWGPSAGLCCCALRSELLRHPRESGGLRQFKQKHLMGQNKLVDTSPLPALDNYPQEVKTTPLTLEQHGGSWH